MPLFFLIAIGAGALTLGAVGADVAVDGRLGPADNAHTAQAVQAPAEPAFNPMAYPTASDCLNAAAARGISASACQR
jgi:hypothetical protein